MTWASAGGSGAPQPPLSVGAEGVADGSGEAPGSGVGLGAGVGPPSIGVGVGLGFEGVVAVGGLGSGVGSGTVGLPSEPQAHAARQQERTAADAARPLSARTT